jgi:hypothetical protein
VINVQKSAWGTRDEISFTVNLGVRWDEASHIFATRVGPQGPSESKCHIRQRLGILDKRPRDIWWAVDGGRWSPGEGSDCLKPILGTLLPLLERRGLEWVQLCLSRRALVAFKRKFDKTGYPPLELTATELGIKSGKKTRLRGLTNR